MKNWLEKHSQDNIQRQQKKMGKIHRRLISYKRLDQVYLWCHKESKEMRQKQYLKRYRIIFQNIQNTSSYVFINLQQTQVM